NERQDSTDRPATPNGLLVWNKAARMSLPPALLLWLSLLVLVSLCSVFFIRSFSPARWFLGGFVVSHLVVFLLPVIVSFTMRRGFVSLVHLICWTPGLIAIIVDIKGRQDSNPYEIWSYALITIISISFLFDLRDATTFLYFLATGRLPTEVDDEDQNSI
ncbi:MAG: hypothetical protein ABGZ35_05275, partial [Planctomycetaceae bacterium]